MLAGVLALIGGFALLAWAADRLVEGAAAVGTGLGWSTLAVGMLVVGFGTSAPELLVSAVASWQGTPAMAVGNAVGSNITNIGLVLGATALIAPLTVASTTLRREFPLMLGATVLAAWLLRDGGLTRAEGAVLAVAMVAASVVVAWFSRHPPSGEPLVGEFAAEVPAGVALPRALAQTVVALGLLLLASRVVVWGGVTVCRELGVSELVVGLTVIAIGTSLPELAASLSSARKGEPDIALGNVIGSNIFNMLGVLAIPGLVRPTRVEAALVHRDLPVLLTVTALMFLVSYGFDGTRRIRRRHGLLLCLAFVAYELLLYLDA